MNDSSKHHYLPVFYLKGFTKGTGKFKIYNVQENRFIKRGKEFSPESYFYERHANTMEGSFGRTDFIEKQYSLIENKILKVIEKINSAEIGTRYNVVEGDMPLLNMFVSLTYWRLPKNRKALGKIMENTTSDSLGYKVYNKDKSINNEVANRLKEDPNFQTAYKLVNSFLDSVRGLEFRTPYSIVSKHENLPFICSDNPIIFEKEEFPNVYSDNYIVPLSGKRYLIKAETGNIPPYLPMLIDAIIL